MACDFAWLGLHCETYVKITSEESPMSSLILTCWFQLSSALLRIVDGYKLLEYGHFKLLLKMLFCWLNSR